MLLSAGRVVTPARVFAPGWLHVDGERIADVGAGAPPRAADLALPAATVVPGFVDTHVHGGGRGVVRRRSTGGRAPPSVRAHLAHGTTTMMASLVTAAPDELAESVRGLADLGRRRAARRHPPRGAVAEPGGTPARTTRTCCGDPEAGAGRRAARGRARPRPDGDAGAGAAAAGSTPIRRLTAAGVVAGDRAHGRDVRPWRGRRSTRAPGRRPTCSTRCAALRHREPGPGRGAARAPRRLRRAGRGRGPRAPRGARGSRRAPSRERTVLVTDAMAAAAAADGDYRLGRLDGDGARRRPDRAVGGTPGVLTGQLGALPGGRPGSWGKTGAQPR